MNSKKLSTAIVLSVMVTTLITASSCSNAQTYTSPKGYDLTKPAKFNMPDKLAEISGIAFKSGSADVMFAEEDETGSIYYFRLGDKQVNQSTFGKPGDYEDIAILGEQVILLRSDGSLYTFPFKDVKNPIISSVQKSKDILPQGEYEGMYANEKEQLLYVLCKHGGEKGSKACNGYMFKLSSDGEAKQSGTFSIDVKEIEALAGSKKINFRPSALAKNQQTNEWYVLSSVNKMLVVTDAAWKVKAVYPFKPGVFLQPEGIAFDNQNNLYISNEGDKITPGNVLKFAYQR